MLMLAIATSLLFLFSSSALMAMGSASIESDDEDGQTASVRSNHSVSLSIIGAEYSYEQRLADRWTLIGRAGVTTYGSRNSNYINSFDASWTLGAGLTVEPRFYTSILRRQALGRSTANNASDFVSMRIQGYFTGSGSFHVAVTPLYGIRRSESRHWFHEFAFGPCWTINKGFSPAILYRLGFLF